MHLNKIARTKVVYSFKFLLLISIISMSACLATDPKKAGVIEQYDKYSKETTTKVSPIEISADLTAELIRIESEKSGVKVVEALSFIRNGVFDGFNSGWKFLRNHHGYLLIDGLSYDLAVGTHVGDVRRTRSGGMYVVEGVDFLLHGVHMIALSKAKTIGGRLGVTEFNFSSQQVGVINTFAKDSIQSNNKM